MLCEPQEAQLPRWEHRQELKELVIKRRGGREKANDNKSKKVELIAQQRKRGMEREGEIVAGPWIRVVGRSSHAALLELGHCFLCCI